MSWKTKKLGEICRPRQWPTLSKSEMHASGIPVYGANGIIGFTDSPTHTVPTILIGCRGSCGTVHLLKPPGYANGNAMALDDLRSDLVDIQFLQHYFRHRGFDDVTTGAAQPQIVQRNLNQIEIPLPSLEEQKRIAAILDHADELRRKRQQSHGRLNQLGRAVFVGMFGDPVDNPFGFPIRKLGEVGELDRGKSTHRPRNDPALLGGDNPLIQTGDVANADGYVRQFTSTYSELGLRQSRKWPVGTLCITIAANIGKTAILEIEACFPDSVVGFTPNKQTNAEYVQYWMSQIQKRLEEVAPQSAQKNINLAILRDLPIPIPPIAEQTRFRYLIVEIEAQKQRARISAQKTQKLFSALQSVAFQGGL